jgi:DNA repair exonuclease SbcCD ATPase subunit
MNNSFWSEGPTRLRAALENRRSEIDAIYAEIERAEDPSEKLRLVDRLRNVLDEYEASQSEIDRSLFFAK